MSRYSASSAGSKSDPGLGCEYSVDTTQVPWRMVTLGRKGREKGISGHGVNGTVRRGGGELGKDEEAVGGSGCYAGLIGVDGGERAEASECGGGE